MIVPTLPSALARFARRAVVVAIAAAVTLSPCSADCQQLAAATPPSDAALAARIDSVVKADLLPRGFPSVSVVVTRGGRTVVERSWGVANVATGAQAMPATTYNIGSMAKQFTAALVLKLVDAGKLSLTDSIGQHLKGLRPEWNAITVEQLLNHTAGLPRDFAKAGAEKDAVSSDALVAAAARDSLVSKPGTKWAYSNTGYMLLAVLVERLHGKPYGVVLREQIARPLGLTALGWCSSLPASRMATGYVRTSDGKAMLRGDVHTSHELGAAGICATAGDIARWNHALHGGRVLSPASYAAMTTPRGAANGRYGFGLAPRKSPWGAPALVHDGQTAGFSSHNAWYPADSLSVTLLYNALPRIEVDMADVVGTLAVGGTPRRIPPMPVITLPVAATQGEGRPKIVGAYELGAGRMFIVSFENGQLFVTPPAGAKQPLHPRADGTYALGKPDSNTILTFLLEGDVVTSFRVRDNGVERELRKVK